MQKPPSRWLITPLVTLMWGFGSWIPILCAQATGEMWPADIQEAINIGTSDSTRFLRRYVLQTHTGWGASPEVGRVTTPFSRIVEAAAKARMKGLAFSAADVSREMLAAELHVYTARQSAAHEDGPTQVLVFAVTLACRDNGSEHIIEPLRSAPVGDERPNEKVLVYPTDALVGKCLVRVTFDRVARGSTPMASCQTCVFPIDLPRLR